VQVSPPIVASMQPHQREGVRFMWEHVSRNRGCILADSMGLGKTLQAIALIHTCLRSLVTRTVLVLCPAICVRNWVAEIHKWTRDSLAHPVTISHDTDSLVARHAKVCKWKKEGGLLILSYETWLSLVTACWESEDLKQGGVAGLLLDDPGPGTRIRTRARAHTHTHTHIHTHTHTHICMIASCTDTLDHVCLDR
jgi:hypothetical protein